MTDDKQLFANRKEDAGAQAKKAYVSPVLRTYGSVTALTMAKTSTLLDGKVFNLQKSDRRAKENIVRIGTHPLGIGLYLFDYKPEFRVQWGHERRLGVMADEVDTVRPQAVHMDADGYKMVDYGMLN